MRHSFRQKYARLTTAVTLDSGDLHNTLTSILSRRQWGLVAGNPNAGNHAAHDCYDCTDLETTGNAQDPMFVYVIEHGVELQYLPRLLEFFMIGHYTDRVGTQYTSNMRLVDPSIINTNSLLRED